MTQLLCVEGNPDAWDFPLWWVEVESTIVRRRLNKTLRTQTVLTLEAMRTARASGKKAKETYKLFDKLLESLDV